MAARLCFDDLDDLESRSCAPNPQLPGVSPRVSLAIGRGSRPRSTWRRRRRLFGALGMVAIVAACAAHRDALVVRRLSPWCNASFLSAPDDSESGAKDACVIRLTGGAPVEELLMEGEEKIDITSKVGGAAARGTAAAFVAAALSAFTEPVVNCMLVHRCTFQTAIKSLWTSNFVAFFFTVLWANAIKMPFDEVIGLLLALTPLGVQARGLVHGWLHCVFLLPISNFRFRRSIGLPIEPRLLYQAFIPTVSRDMAFGCARHTLGNLVGVSCGGFGVGCSLAEASHLGLTVFLACLASAPFNEWRGYWLQPPDQAMSFRHFFRPERCLRSTLSGATIMSLSIALGTVAQRVLL